MYSKQKNHPSLVARRSKVEEEEINFMLNIKMLSKFTN